MAALKIKSLRPESHVPLPFLPAVFFTKAPRNTELIPTPIPTKQDTISICTGNAREKEVRAFPCLRDKDAVYDVVHCLYKHQDDCWRSHTKSNWGICIVPILFSCCNCCSSTKHFPSLLTNFIFLFEISTFTLLSLIILPFSFLLFATSTSTSTKVIYDIHINISTAEDAILHSPQIAPRISFLHFVFLPTLIKDVLSFLGQRIFFTALYFSAALSISFHVCLHGARVFKLSI